MFRHKDTDINPDSLSDLVIPIKASVESRRTVH